MIQQQLEAESSAASGWSRSPITPTTTRKFNRMAIHEVLDGQNSPSFKRKGSPEEGSFSDPPTSSSRLGSRVSSSRAYNQHSDSNHTHTPHHHHAHFAPSQPHSPRFRQESPMPVSNSDDDEDSDIRNYKKRRMLASSSTTYQHLHNSHPHPHHHHHHKNSPSSSSPNGGGLATAASGQSSTGGGPQAEVMDQVRNTLKLKQQQKAIIEARQGGAVHPLSASTPTTASSPPSNSNGAIASNGSGNNNSISKTSSQPVTEKNPSGISVFHGSASFAAMNRRPLTSPKNPKNAKSLTIFAPSYSESSLSIRSAPLQPSHGHQIMSMNPRTSQPLRHQTPHHHQPHPFSQHQQTATPRHDMIPQPLRSPKTAGHIRKSSRATLRAGPHTAGLDSSSGTLPAPILSSHTGPLPSPMYPHPNTPFHPSSHASLAAAASTNAAAAAAAAAGGAGTGSMSKHHFMETVSNLFDSVDSSRSLKHTLDEQIRKSAQLLQTLQSSGTMIESLVRGQFKELEKGVLDKFENELEHLSARVRQLEEHQGLTPPPKKARTSSSSTSTTAATTVTVSSQNAMTGIVSTSNSTSTLSSSSSSPKAGSTSSMASSPLHNQQHHSGSGSAVKDGMLPTPPLNKTQDSAMEVEDEEELPTAPPATESTTPPPQDQAGSSSEYRSSVKKLQERVASLEKRQEPATTTVQA
ncbi:hypothetical protein BGX24_009668 [Mortierella sp. AD032]|nr:hypothetical protein BGX24_009668 [Mortierella sp. AD032]